MRLYAATKPNLPMKHTTLFLLLLLTISARGQQTEGVVNYERVTHWAKMYARLTYLSQEEKDRIQNTWKNDDEDKQKMKLTFNADQSQYTYAEEQGQTENGDYSWRQNDYIINRDFAKERTTDIIEMLGKTYIIEDSLRVPVWKIGDQIKDVAGHLCMKATTDDPIRGQHIVAWFAQDIPVSAGPERYAGLPGIILELDINNGDVVIEAKKIELKPATTESAGQAAATNARAWTKLPKLKGKRINEKDYNTLISNHISQSIKAHRNPFWSIRY
jgi:GLPGLI family protein